VVVCRVARPAVEDRREGHRLAYPTDVGVVVGHRPPQDLATFEWCRSRG
jgi:hypothetical protein